MPAENPSSGELPIDVGACALPRAKVSFSCASAIANALKGSRELLGFVLSAHPLASTVEDVAAFDAAVFTEAGFALPPTPGNMRSSDCA